MTQARIIFGLLVALLFAAGSCWFFLQNGDEANDLLMSSAQSQADVFEDNTCSTIEPLEESSGESEANNDAKSKGSTVAEGQGQTVVEGESEDAQESSQVPDDRRSRRQTDGSRKTKKNAQSKKSKQAKSPRKKLTRKQREQARSAKTGRPALKKRLTRTPRSSISGKAAKTPELQEWVDSFVEDGLEPPEMIPTKVTGKIMSSQSREGLAKATVGLMTFFPLDGLAGGPLYPVLTTLATDDEGNFAGEIPGSQLAPSNYAALAITVAWEGHTVLAGQPAAVFEAGVENSLGVIWAPTQPYQIRCDASAFGGNLAVVTTGDLDPQRWHLKKRVEAFSWFPKFKPLVILADSGPIPAGLPQEGQCDVIGTWGDDRILPYISLTREGVLVDTRRPKLSAVMSNTSAEEIEQPFEKLVFDGGNKQPISGQVLDSNGAGIANAEVTALGGNVTQTVITDSVGWFNFEVAPEKTSYLHIVHIDWVETQQEEVAPGDTAVTVMLITPRPRFMLQVIDMQTQSPLAKIGLRIIGFVPFGKRKGKSGPEEYIELENQTGEYAFEWKHEIKTLVVEKIGYFPYTIKRPSRRAEQNGGEISVELNQGRELTFRPRDYTNTERSDQWFPDSGETGPGVFTYSSMHWLEYDVDFGEEPEAEQEGGFFDIILGCTNAGIVDNDYEFEVEVIVDNKVVGKVKIQADSTTIRTGRISLGKLSGTHSIRLRWLNDKWIPGQLDANIRYASMVFVEQPS